MDASTIAALAALAIAVFAFFVTIAQVIQQYFITGQLIRICDSVVYGPMPGQGRRIWEGSQFRFRVVYSIPQISLRSDLWPREAPHTPSYSRASHLLPELPVQSEQSKPQSSFSLSRRPRSKACSNNLVGEASWVTFCRVTQYSCRSEVFYELVEEDADRHPSDVPVAAMKVSLRDIVIMAFMAGMECTSADFEKQSISMQGACGSITTSQHPILGPLIHYNPKNASLYHGIRVEGGSINSPWIQRIWNNLTVAGKTYTEYQRALTEKMDHYEVEGPDTGLAHQEYSYTSAQAMSTGQTRKRGTYAFKGEDLTQPALHASLPPSRSGQVGKPTIDQSEVIDDIPRGDHDGSWAFGTNIPRLSRTVHSTEMTYLGVDLQRLEAHPDPAPAAISYPQPPSRPDSEELGFMMTRPAWYQRVIRAVRAFVIQQILNRDSRPGDTGSERRAYWRDTSPVRESLPIKEKPSTAPLKAIVEDDYRSPSQISLPLSVISIDIHPPPDESSSVTDLSRFPPDFLRPHKPTKGKMTSHRETYDPTFSERQELARKSQQARREKAAKEREDEKVAAKLDAEQQTRETRPGLFMLEWHPSDHIESSKSGSAEEEAFRRQKERQRERDERNRARVNRAQNRNLDNEDSGKIKWFWTAQMDIIPGLWATIWYHCFSDRVCVGAIQVILQALLGLTNDSFIQYVHPGLQVQYFRWADEGKSTFPAYAINARNGVVVGGQYRKVNVSAFVKAIPPLELHYSYEHQVGVHWIKDDRSSQEKTAELMSLDSWLSICGRTPEIRKGRGDLLQRTPAIVQFVMGDYEDDFRDLIISAQEGGFQAIQDVTRNVMDTLEDQRLSEAEQIYVLVAMLRAVKVARSIIQGVDTQIVEKIILKDIQVYFA